jgi:hypothetical protein
MTSIPSFAATCLSFRHPSVDASVCSRPRERADALHFPFVVSTRSRQHNTKTIFFQIKILLCAAFGVEEILFRYGISAPATAYGETVIKTTGRNLHHGDSSKNRKKWKPERVRRVVTNHRESAAVVDANHHIMA